MYPEEAEAHKLTASLTAAGIPAEVQGAGVHWQVVVAPMGGRSLSVDCFWYDRHFHGLMLGMNPANARSRLVPTQQVRHGPEFAISLRADGNRVAEGRTPNQDQVLACARTWLSGATLERLVEELPFIDEKPRAMKAVAAQLDPRLTWEIGFGPSYELWVYGAQRSSRERSCQVLDDSCAFFIGQAQVAFLQPAEDVPNLIAAWLIDDMPLGSLVKRGVQLERHAEVLETDPARWHWLHVRDRIANPNDVLFPLASLISTLADSPIASQFFTFSSLNRLGFSASSHYPWVGLFPPVSPIEEEEYDVDGERCTLPEAVAKIESALAQSPVKPFFGSAPHHDIRAFKKIFAQQGSSLRPQLVRRGLWTDILMVHGSRKCILDSDHITCMEGNSEFHAACAAVNDVVRIAIRFLLERASYDELKTDSGVIRSRLVQGSSLNASRAM